VADPYGRGAVDCIRHIFGRCLLNTRSEGLLWQFLPQPA
jgi:hypothetical protein